MRADDVTDTLRLALTASGCDAARVAHKPRLLSDNGSSYVSGDLAKWLEDEPLELPRCKGGSSPAPRPCLKVPFQLRETYARLGM